MLPKKTERMLIRHPQPNRAQYVEQDFKKAKAQSKDYHRPCSTPTIGVQNYQYLETLKKDAVISYA